MINRNGSSAILFTTFVMSSAVFSVPCITGPDPSNNLCVAVTEIKPDGNIVTFNAYGGGYSNGKNIDFSDKLSWSSNKDGYLGNGESITVALSSGYHVITASWGYPGANYSGEKNVFVREKFCSTESASVALTHDVYYTTHFKNQESAVAKIYWLSYTNERVLYATLMPGETVDVNGYPGNQWLITDTYDQCIDVVSVAYSHASHNIKFEH